MRIKKLLKIALSILTCTLLLGIVPACARSSSDPEQETGPKFIAHSGFSSTHLGNTEAAFRAAAEMGFYGIETDIRKTLDGYFICNHDATVLYADGTEKKISTTKRANLLSRPLKNDKNGEAAYLCTFETYLQVCKDGGKVAVIELKDFTDEYDARTILGIVDAEYDRKKVMFISFSYTSLLSVKKVDPSIELQYLSQTEGDRTLENCLRDNISIDVKQTILTEEMVQTYHEAGLKVNVWTVNEGTDLQRAEELGVDYITTDVFCEE